MMFINEKVIKITKFQKIPYPFIILDIQDNNEIIVKTPVLSYKKELYFSNFFKFCFSD